MVHKPRDCKDNSHPYCNQASHLLSNTHATGTRCSPHVVFKQTEQSDNSNVSKLHGVRVTEGKLAQKVDAHLVL